MSTVRPGGAAGRTVAIVPAHEQHQDDLRACVLSIANQRHAVVDEIHVVDDGSVRRPVQPFPHPRVHWHRTDHAGTVAAQVYVLDRLRPQDWDYVLTLDGVWVLDDWAVEHQLRVLTRRSVASTCGTVLVRGPRVAALHAAAGATGPAEGRALLGILDRVAGAPAVHRARVLFAHRDRYLAERSDRCLALLAAMDGDVVAVGRSIAWSPAPVASYRHRLDWSRAWWRMLPTVLRGMRPRHRSVFPVAGLLWLVAAPLITVYVVVSAVASVLRGELPDPAAVLAVLLYLLARYARMARHLARRPDLDRPAKVRTLLLLTPAEAAYHLLVGAPTRYLGLLTAREREEDTRNGTDPEDSPPSRGPAAGVLYQSGHAVWR